MKAAIRVVSKNCDQVFTGRSHFDAMMAVLAANIPMDLKLQAQRSLELKTENTGFLEDDGTFITRTQAKAKYGCYTSEDMLAKGLM